MNRCKLCYSRKVKLFRYVGEYTLFRCIRCDVVYIDPQPDSRRVKNNNISFYDASENEIAYFKKKEEVFNRATICAGILKKYKSHGTLLDIGCSYGFYLNIFRRKGYRCFGIDPLKRPVDYAKKTLRLSVKQTNLENLNGRKKYDVITLFDVLEHLPNPQETIQKIKKILNKDGIIIFQTPNYQSLMSRFTGNRWFWLLVPQHLFLYSVHSLKFLLNKNGFSILEIYSWDDIEEFIDNLLLPMRIKNSGKSKILYQLLFPLLVFIFGCFSHLWNRFLLGGENVIYGKKIK